MAVLATACWLVFVKRNTSRPSEADGRRLPPGSRGFPIIGETLEFLTESPANQLPAFFKRRLDRSRLADPSVGPPPSASFPGATADWIGLCKIQKKLCWSDRATKPE
ncbi:hypothetical protein OsI_33123 [Oryza sativa Indica Group]|uniref:Uncharacterized protein n=1 Tax=Oryza sativa subsp. indica TaxID=39946 RepID=B8BGA1_ORYSI|nr:hypothetical protein OsI_33123 [Oryza sativa Indica Group]